MPDPIFSERRLAAIYDAFDGDRSDLDVYAAIVDELGARTVLDIGCGTGTLACVLARRGLEVVGVDPAAASLEVARTKPDADGVTWICGDATTLPPLQVQLATMTGNVAQVFLSDDAWSATLRGTAAALQPDGHLVVETRVPAQRAWLDWDRQHTQQQLDLPGVGLVTTWCDLLDVTLPLVTFRWTNVFAADGAVRTSDSTLRFRDRDEVERSLHDAGFTVDDVRDAPDRPGQELVFLARRSSR
ncbi:MAG: class I SAM-dependent methyltransferase [Ilumatobacteraceae bacterium]